VFHNSNRILSLRKKVVSQNPLLFSLAKYILPLELVDYFDSIHLEETGESLHIHLDELNIIPEEYATLELSLTESNP
jgi:hypothetical protein